MNNYTDEHVSILRSIAETPSVRYLIFGREVAPTTNTPHLQGFVIFDRAQRHSYLRNRLNGVHTELTRGSSQAAATYCKKEGDFEEFGDFPDEQGKRTDIEKFTGWVQEFIELNGRIPSQREIATNHPTTFVKYSKACLAYCNAVAPSPKLRDGEPNDWQRSLEEDLENDADDRSVVFYVDAEGGKGKTWFQQYYVTKFPEKCQILGIGKRDDMTFAIDETKSVFLINVPRGSMQYLQYAVLEQLKDRMVFSTKYQTRMKTLAKSPHVIVFCNEEPDMEKMSADRYSMGHF